MSKIFPVVLCGGSGTRLWPRSRKIMPKPFLPLVGEETLFEATLGRCSNQALFAAPIVVTGARHLAHVESQLGTPGEATIIVEPEARNTAAAIALAAATLPADAIMLVCPSDHHIADVAAFESAAAAAAGLARDDWLVSFGITPDAPETGFGYIKRAAELPGGFQVERFVEKPDRQTAEAFLSDGGYSWNGGIFAFRAGFFMNELDQHRPDIAGPVRRAVAQGERDGAHFRPDGTAFGEAGNESVDYAVMEKTARAAMVPVAMGWSDIGNWHALRDARSGDASANRIKGPAQLIDCENVLVETDGPRVNIIGLSDIAVVVDGDEVLVTSMAGTQKVGKLDGAASQ